MYMFRQSVGLQASGNVGQASLINVRILDVHSSHSCIHNQCIKRYIGGNEQNRCEGGSAII
jgi:hypothetical protein